MQKGSMSRGKLSRTISDTINSVMLDMGDKIAKISKREEFPHELISSLLMNDLSQNIHPVGIGIVSNAIRKDLGRKYGTTVSYFYISYLKAKCDLEEIINMDLSETQLYEICISLVSIIADIHCVGVVHGDVSPKNFLFSEGQFLATDFGDCYPLTNSTAVYTQGYQAPEVVFGKCQTPASFRTDVWALGATIYSVLLGDVVTVDRVIGKNEQVELDEEYRELLIQSVPNYPKLVEVCIKCLKHDPSKRYDDALQVYADLTGETSCITRVRFDSLDKEDFAKKLGEWIKSTPKYRSLKRKLETDVVDVMRVMLEGSFDDRLAPKIKPYMTRDIVETYNYMLKNADELSTVLDTFRE